jgi:DNA-binding MarR family transcriptional regulator
MSRTAPGDPPGGELTTVDALAQLAFAIQGLLDRSAGEHRLSITQTRLLGVLRDREPTMQELTRLLGLDKSSVSGLVDRAERRGLVARIPSPSDGRVVLVRLTEAGRGHVGEVATRFEADVTALLAPLTRSDRDTLTRLVTGVLVADARARDVDLFATGGDG